MLLTPLSAKQAYEADLRTARQQHEQMQESARAKYVLDLDQLQRFTMAGNLDMAIKIREELTTVNAAAKSAGEIETTRTKLAGPIRIFERKGGENARLSFSPNGSLRFNDGPAGNRRWIVFDFEAVWLLLEKNRFRLKFNPALTQYAVQSGHVEIETTWIGEKR